MAKAFHKALLKKWAAPSRIFAALGDAHRQRILLVFERGEELTIKQVVEACPLSRTAVAHHIRVLRDAGVLSAQRRGKEVYLRPDPGRVLAALNAVRDYIREEL